MRALHLALGAALLGGGYYWYSKSKKPIAPGTPGSSAATASTLQTPVAADGTRTLSDDQRSAVTNALANYVIGAPPAPIPNCASGGVITGRQPAGGETVSAEQRLSNMADAAVAAGGEVYLTADLVGPATLGTDLPASVMMTYVDAGVCPDAKANLKAQGWYLYKSPLTAVASAGA